LAESVLTESPRIAKKERATFDRPLLLSPGQNLAGYAGHTAGRTALTAVACFTILAVLLIFAFVAGRSWQFLTAEGHGITEMFNTDNWHPTSSPPKFGALGVAYGSLMVTIAAVLVCGPVGVLAAVCLSDILPFNVRQIAKPVIEILAAIPSVAYGFFAILVVAPKLQQWGMTPGTNALNASVLLSVMALPTVVSIAEDALSSVGRDLREGAYALGATRAEVMFKVVIPAAGSGIIAAIILGIMRAIGETMLVLMAAGNATGLPVPWYDLSSQVTTMTARIAGEMGEAPDGGLHRSALFALGLILAVITFALNLVSSYLLGRNRRRQGAVK
jgi:phosphate ABC transporter permease protein PstC